MTDGTQYSFNFEAPVISVPPVLAPHVTTARVSSKPIAGRIEVPAGRLEDGDIDQSYSADMIDKGKVRKPFLFNGRLYTGTAGVFGPGICQMTAYWLVPENAFDGAVTTHSDKVQPDRGAKARKDPKGFYDGIRVSSQGKKYVLSGPPLVFYCQPEEVEADESESLHS